MVVCLLLSVVPDVCSRLPFLLLVVPVRELVLLFLSVVVVADSLLSVLVAVLVRAPLAGSVADASRVPVEVPVFTRVGVVEVLRVALVALPLRAPVEPPCSLLDVVVLLPLRAPVDVLLPLRAPVVVLLPLRAPVVVLLPLRVPVVVLLPLRLPVVAAPLLRLLLVEGTVVVVPVRGRAPEVRPAASVAVVCGRSTPGVQTPL